MQQAPITPAKITLGDDKERVLRYSNAALKTIKEKYGVSICREGTWKLLQTLDEFQLAELLVLGLDHNKIGGEPGITLAVVDDLLDSQNTGMAIGQVLLALGNSIAKNVLDATLKVMENAKAAAEKAAAEKAAATNPPEPIPPTEAPPTVM
jgi:hypothetical protein